MTLIYALLLLSVAAVAVVAQNAQNQQCGRFPLAQFCKDEVVPDVIPSPPSSILQVAFPFYNLVNLGNRLSRSATKDAPSVSLSHPPNESGALYTLAMVDPDATSRANPVLREYLHWLIVDQTEPAYKPQEGDCASSKTVLCYVGPAPPEGSGPHRYVVLLYKQQRGGPIRNQVNVSDRPKFSIANFAQQYGLELIAANYFTAKNPDDTDLYARSDV